MKVTPINDYKDIHQDKETVLVLGYFDALHRGHKVLFDKARQIADEKQLEVAVFTFNESPQLTFQRYTDDLLLHITAPQRRCDLFKAYGTDQLYLTDFNSDFARTSSDDFITRYINRLKAQEIVVGFDYKFGHHRTDTDYLDRNFSGTVHVIEEQQSGGEKISSTRVRQLIREGNVKEANNLLGHEFSTRGIVVHGDARGRTIGFPTANLAPIDRTILPADGVYVADVVIDGKRYRSMTSLGKNVTFGGTELRLEANNLLGHEFSTRGIVVHGDARGRTIGFPTANLAPIDRTILPADGVYVADVVIDGKRYRSMTSLGKNVTFGGTELRLEANIFDFEGDIYGKTIEVFWLDYIRDMIKFNNIDELCDQLKADKKIAEKL